MIENAYSARKDARPLESRLKEIQFHQTCRKEPSALQIPHQLIRGGRVLKRKKLILSAAACSFFLMTGVLPSAANEALYWLVQPFSYGGSGIWDAQNTNWRTNSSYNGGVDSPWIAGDFAVFAAQHTSAGTVTIDDSHGMVTVDGLEFADDGYVIRGDALNIVNNPSTQNALFEVGQCIGDNPNCTVTGTVEAQIVGTGSLQKENSGTLVLEGDNSYTGNTIVYGGILRAGISGHAFGTGVLEMDNYWGVTVDLANYDTAVNGLTDYTLLNWNYDNIKAKSSHLMLGSAVLTVNQSIDGRFDGTISGTGRIVKSGTGSLWLSGINTYSGGTELDGGVLQAGLDANLGSASGNLTFDGGTLQLAAAFDTARLTHLTGAGTIDTNGHDSTFSGKLDGTGSLTKSGSGKLVLSGDSTYSGGTIISAGTLQLGSGANGGSIDGAIIDNGTLTFNHSGAFTLSNQVSGTGRLVIDGQQKVSLTGQNTYSGGTVVTNSVVSVADNTALGSDMGALNLTDSSLLLTGKIASGRALALNGAQDTLANDYDTTFSGQLTGHGGLLKSGGGILTLSGKSDSYTGPITISDGGLVADGSIAASVAADRGTFVTGSGSVGDLTIADGATLRGTQGLILTAQSVSLGNQSSTDITLGTPESTGLFDVSGDLHLGGTLNVTDGGGFSAGVYRIFNYGGDLSGSMTIGGLPSNADIHRVTLQTNQLHQVNLINASGVTLSFWDGANPANLDNNRVDGGNGIWDAQQQFWTDANGSQNGNWATGTFAIFSGEKGTVAVDNSKGEIRAAGMQFMTDGYLLTGAPLALDNDNATPIITVGDHSEDSANITATIEAELTGTHGMEKTDAGRLILTADNSYTGTTKVSGGVLQLGNNGTSGSVKDDIAIAKGAELELRRSNDLNLDHAIAGEGQVLQNGDGTTILAADNSFSGGLTVRKGTAKAGFEDQSFGSGLLTVEKAGTSALDGYDTTVGGLAGSGAVHLDDATLTLDQDINTKFEGSIDGKGGFTKDGTGIIELSGSNSYEGQSLIENGSVLQTGQGAISANSAYSVSNPALIDLGGFSSTMAGLNNAGTLRFGGMNAGTVLDVTGDYHGQGGTFVMNTVLGDDHSTTDQLVIGGSTDGDTKLQIVNRGGLGAQTVDGIKVVDVAGQSDGTFELAKGDFVTKAGEQAVIGGAYAYTLHKNGKTTPDDGNWYLRSELKDPQVNPFDPVNPDNPVQPSSPLYSPTIPLYEGLINNMQSLNQLSTMRERIGDRYLRETGNELALDSLSSDDNNGNSVIWGRMVGGHDHIASSATTGNLNQKIDRLQFQAGTDGKLYDGDKGTVLFDVSGLYGSAINHVGASIGSGNVSTSSWGANGSLTWFGQDGFYLDAQTQANWYKNDLYSAETSSIFLGGLQGTGQALSLEAGKQFVLNDQWAITPQAQIQWSSVHVSDARDLYQSTLNQSHGAETILRAGLAFDYATDWQTADGTTANATLYGVTNITQNLPGRNAVNISDVSFTTKNDKTWADLGAGGSFKLNDHYSFYGQGKIGASLIHPSRNYYLSGNIGVRVNW